jgi:hypothetical protein
MSQLADEPVDTHPASMPRGLRVVLAVLGFQVLGNAFLGSLLVADGDPGLGYLLGCLSLAVAAVLVLCVVFTVRPRAWVRPTVIAVQSLVILNGAVNLLSGAVAGLVGIGLGIAVISVLTKDDVRNWYQL